MTINEKLLRDTIKIIEKKPEQWDQRTWGRSSPEGRVSAETVGLDREDPSEYTVLPEGVTCGTSMCLAGHVVTQSGYPLVWWDGDSSANWCVNPETKKLEDISKVAARLLGLDQQQAGAVFHSHAARQDWKGAFPFSDYENESEDDVIELFKKNITAWTGVTFPEEPEAKVVKVNRVSDKLHSINVRELAREEDSLYLGRVDDRGEITLTPVEVHYVPKEN